MNGPRPDQGDRMDRVLGAPQLAELREQGFYLLRGLLDEAEAGELLAETRRLIDRAPAAPKGPIDAHGDPVSHPEDYLFPLADTGKPVLNRIRYPAWRSRPFLEAYGNPRILHAAHELYGDLMVPFDESIVLKMPYHGAGFPWHQDGNFKTGAVAERGHNFGIYLTPSAVANGAVHVLPGSHRRGVLDLAAMAERHGFALPGSVAAPAGPGDANVHSRSIAHGSQPNASPDLRVTWYVGSITAMRSAAPGTKPRSRTAACSSRSPSRRAAARAASRTNSRSPTGTSVWNRPRPPPTGSAPCAPSPCTYSG